MAKGLTNLDKWLATTAKAEEHTYICNLSIFEDKIPQTASKLLEQYS